MSFILFLLNAAVFAAFLQQDWLSATVMMMVLLVLLNFG